MVSQRRRVFVTALVGADIVALLVSYALAFRVRFPDSNPFAADTAHGETHVLLCIAGVAIWLLALSGLGFYRPERSRRPGSTLGALIPTGGLVFLLLGAVLFLVQAKLASRLVLGLFVVFATLGVWLDRVAAGRAMRWWGRRANPLVLILGAGSDGRRLGRRLADEPELGVEPAGYLRFADEVVEVSDDQLLGELSELERVLDERVVDLVAVAHAGAQATQIEALAQTCHEVGVDVVVVASEMDALLARAAVDFIGGASATGGVPALRLSGSPQFRARMASKRLFDLCVASALLVISAPLWLALAIAIKATSRGPCLHRQERVGLNGRRFVLFKLRSMVADAEAQRDELEPANEMSGPVFKVTDDPRVTTVGRFLRRFSLDELPQLVNVVRGEMSLVGPRPPLPSEVEQYDRWQRRRLSVKPGMTGVWQVSGRNDVDFDDWMALDLGYIDNWSPWLDLKILVKTIPAVLSGRGAR